MILISSSLRQKQDQDQEVDPVLQRRKPRILVTELLNIRLHRVVLVEPLAAAMHVKSSMDPRSVISMLER